METNMFKVNLNTEIPELVIFTDISTSGSTSDNKKGLVTTNSPLGSALGPDWSSGLHMSGVTEDKVSI